MEIRVRATYDTVSWSDGEEPEPIEEGGWTDPRHPWGGLRQDRDDLSAEPDTLTFPNAWEAAQFAVDFPGGVWDWSESEAEQDYRTGEWTSVTLHILDHTETVFALMDLGRVLLDA